MNRGALPPRSSGLCSSNGNIVRRLTFFHPDCLRELLPGPFLLSYSLFVFSFPLFFVSVPRARLNLTGHSVSFWAHVNISYRIVIEKMVFLSYHPNTYVQTSFVAFNYIQPLQPMQTCIDASRTLRGYLCIPSPTLDYRAFRNNTKRASHNATYSIWLRKKNGAD